MNRRIPTLSQGLLILGGLLILAGIGWGIWSLVNRPPDPTISDAGAVVLAVTAPVRRNTATPEPTPVSETAPPTPPPPTRAPSITGPTPALLPDWTVMPQPSPTNLPATEPPPTATPEPTPTSLPPAQSAPNRIVAPAIELDAEVVPMGWELTNQDGTFITEWVVPERAAGWHMNSALPGNVENVVLSGHHNIEGKVFRYVVDLEPGDDITLYADGIAYTYLVSEKYILKESGMSLSVRKKNAQWIMPSGDERLTLVTCWPYEWPGNSHRVVVVARPPSYFWELGEDAKDSGVE
jgi:sortase A